MLVVKLCLLTCNDNIHYTTLPWIHWPIQNRKLFISTMQRLSFAFRTNVSPHLSWLQLLSHLKCHQLQTNVFTHEISQCLTWKRNDMDPATWQTVRLQARMVPLCGGNCIWLMLYLIMSGNVWDQERLLYFWVCHLHKMSDTAKWVQE